MALWPEDTTPRLFISWPLVIEENVRTGWGWNPWMGAVPPFLSNVLTCSTPPKCTQALGRGRHSYQRRSGQQAIEQLLASRQRGSKVRLELNGLVIG